MKNFLLEHYRQVNEHLRETDRKRNILLGLYIPTGGILTLLTFPDSPFMDVLNGSLVIFVSFVVVWIIMGIFVFYGITVFRRWHIEFRNVTIGIHRAFVNEDYDLFKAMREICKSDKFGDYYNPKGTQIVFPLLVLLNQVVLPLYACFHYWNGKGVFFFLPIAIILIVCVEYWFYHWYLEKEESSFKDNPAVSWCIMPPMLPVKRKEKMKEKLTPALVLIAIGVALFATMKTPVTKLFSNVPIKLRFTLALFGFITIFVGTALIGGYFLYKKLKKGSG